MIVYALWVTEVHELQEILNHAQLCEFCIPLDFCYRENQTFDFNLLYFCPILHIIYTLNLIYVKSDKAKAITPLKIATISTLHTTENQLFNAKWPHDKLELKKV